MIENKESHYVPQKQNNFTKEKKLYHIRGFTKESTECKGLVHENHNIFLLSFLCPM